MEQGRVEWWWWWYEGCVYMPLLETGLLLLSGRLHSQGRLVAFLSFTTDKWPPLETLPPSICFVASPGRSGGGEGDDDQYPDYDLGIHINTAKYDCCTRKLFAVSFHPPNPRTTYLS